MLAPVPAPAGELDVGIRLYDLATSDARGREAAMRAASDAIATAGITLRWRDCSRGGRAHPCRTVRGAGDLVVRVMPSRGAAAGDPSSPLEPPSTQLGFVPIDPSGRATVVATIYYDVVLRVARRTGLSANALLGRAIAHEIGHLLLREPGHGDSGLMRRLWTDEELMRNRAEDWTFSEADRRQVQTVVRESDTSPGRADDSSDSEAIGR